MLPVFAKFPEEAAVVGSLLLGYGELEFDLCFCVSVAIGDTDTVLKAMFRVRGEKDRIDIADALGRKAHRDLDLETQFGEVIAATHYCRKIRNQFAHCHWHNDFTGRLGFVNLQEIAIQNRVVDLRNITVNYVDVSLLREQEAYFRFTTDCLHFLNFECKKRSRKIAANPFRRPRKLKRPPLHKFTSKMDVLE